MSGRGISTVVDVTICLLLVSASVAVLLGATGGDTAEPASPRATASSLGAVTASVEYGPGADNLATGTLAELLAVAAIVEAQDAPPEARFITGVRAAVRGFLANVSGSARIEARWYPDDGDRPDSVVGIGPRPPPIGNVDVATIRLAGWVAPRLTATQTTSTLGRSSRTSDLRMRDNGAGSTRPRVVRIVVRTWRA